MCIKQKNSSTIDSYCTSIHVAASGFSFEFKILKYFPFRYLNIYVGMPDVEESFNVTRPVSPHEVSLLFFFLERQFVN